MTDEGFASLAEELEGMFARGVDVPLSDSEFAGLALRSFAVQFGANPTYGAFCRARGVTPDVVTAWEDIPAVPATAFKHVDLFVGEPGAAEAVFRTSGTTEGAGSRGRHLVKRLSLYRASLLPNLGANLVPEDRPLPLLSLVPSPQAAPDSSLSLMVGAAAERWGAPTRWMGHPVSGPDVEAFLDACGEVVAAGTPALVTGTAFAFVHLLDALAGKGLRLALPEGTRVMETGGFKGRSRVVERDELYGEIGARLGVPVHRIVNEYGMTELLSQLYEPLLREGPQAPRRHVPPPWLRVRALDPTTLAPLPEGEAGLLCFFDLANLGSVSHILTEDVGTVSHDGLRLAGRVAGAEPRGCSLALDDLLSATGGTP